jgi:dTDP-4-dehydrorhamnose 3,5-epimerase
MVHVMGIFGRVEELPSGVVLHELVSHVDERGAFTEVFRNEWDTAIDPAQWNYVRSAAGVLRGVHVHIRHSDYLMVVEGEAVIGVRDLRTGSPTFGVAATVDVTGGVLRAIEFPPGVAHGFCFSAPSAHLYAVSHYWDEADELGCRWDDEGLGIEWPDDSYLVSERDAQALSLDELMRVLEPHQPDLWSGN